MIHAIPHGITDIVDAPVESILTYAILCPLVYHIHIEVKTGFLLCGYIYHLRHDVPLGLKGNVLMHLLWIRRPIIPYPASLLFDTYGLKIKCLWVWAYDVWCNCRYDFQI